MRTRDATTEQGFTIVEVVIAALLLAVIAGGVAMAVAGSSKLQGRAKVNASLTSVSRKVTEGLRSNRDWMSRTDCRKTGAADSCNLLAPGAGSSWTFDSSALHDGDLKIDWKMVSLTAKGVDSKVDGTGPGDSDGVVPDYFRISVHIAPPDAATRQRLGGIPDLEFTTALDERGNVARGSIEVDVCQVKNQIDERMSISDCGNSNAGTAIRMDGCPPASLPGCTAAMGTVAGKGRSLTQPSPNVELRPVTSSAFQLVNPATGSSVSSGGHQLQVNGSPVPGKYLFPDLEAGSYEVHFSSVPAGTVRWASHELPGPGGKVSVEPDARAKSLIMFRPAALATMTLNFQRKIHRYVLASHWTPWDEFVHHKPTVKFLGTAPQLQQTQQNYTSTVDGKIYWETSQQYAWGVPRANCVTVYHEFTEDKGPVDGADAFLPGLVHYWHEDGISLTYYPYEDFFYCSYYNTYLRHRVWAEDAAQRTQAIVPGAWESATYDMKAAPDHRELMSHDHSPNPANPDTPFETARDTSNPSVYYTTAGGGAPPLGTAGPFRPASSCLGIDNEPDLRMVLTRGCDATGYSSVLNGGGAAATSRIVMNFVSPGLYTGIRSGPAGAASSNRDLGAAGFSAMLGANALWVQPNGVVSALNGGAVANSGTANPSVTMTGTGECYWRTPAFGGGPHLGSCDRCHPYWSPNHFTSDRCTLLDRSDCKKYAYFTKEFHADGSIINVDTTGDWKNCPDIVNNPPLECSAYNPDAQYATCHHYTPGPPLSAGTTTHNVHVPSGGNQTVNTGNDTKVVP